MEPSVVLQKQVRDNAKDLHSFMADMRDWERDMKLKEARLPVTDVVQDVPPVRTAKQKKLKGANNKPKQPKRISSSDYLAWEKFDADKACKQVDEENEAQPPQDGQESEEDKKQEFLDEAHYEKERGNLFVQVKKWDEAIACYTRAIDLLKTDATFYANRALCHLKKENLHAAESDCTAALSLDPTYAKALLRRSSAREGLGSLRRAASDLTELLKLEPNNESVRRQLHTLIQRMGTKGPNFKSSPATTPSSDTPPLPFNFNENVLRVDNNENSIRKEKSTPEDEKLNVENETNVDSVDYAFIEAIEKSPHLRSKKTLKRIPVTEVIDSKESVTNVQQNNSEAPVPIQENCDQTLVASACENDTVDVHKDIVTSDTVSVVDSEVVNLLLDEVDDNNKFTIPKSSIQFVSDWRLLKGRDKERSAYLSTIPAVELPNIFKNSLESDTLSEILNIILVGTHFMKGDIDSFSYLASLTKVKRFSALSMFLSSDDKQVVAKILERSKAKAENAEIINELREKYEISEKIV